MENEKKYNLVYTIFRGEELIWARNYLYEDLKKAEQDLENTYNDIKTKEEVSNIQYTENKKLDFLSNEEKHVFMITN